MLRSSYDVLDIYYPSILLLKFYSKQHINQKNQNNKKKRKTTTTTTKAEAQNDREEHPQNKQSNPDTE